MCMSIHINTYIYVHIYVCIRFLDQLPGKKSLFYTMEPQKHTHSKTPKHGIQWLFDSWYSEKSVISVIISSPVSDVHLFDSSPGYYFRSLGCSNDNNKVCLNI